MAQFRQYTPIALAILLGLVLQVVLVFADSKDSPSKAAVKFSKAYFMLNPSMSNWLCEKRKTFDDADMVEHYRYIVFRQAKARGFSLGYMKNRLYDIETHTLHIDDASAEIRLTGKRRFAMNPIYGIVAQIFGFSKPLKVDQTLSLVKENNTWKVCGGLFDFPEKI